MTWIQLVIHPEHEKVLRIADLTGTSPDAAFVGSVRWFWWVDAHAANADLGISASSFRVVTRWADDGLSRAMLHADVDWLAKGSDGLLRPTRFESHFDKNAKRRALHAKQTAEKRVRMDAHKCAQSCAQSEHLQQEKELDTEPERTTTTPKPVVVVAGAVNPVERDAIRDLLTGVGFGCQEAIRLSCTPHLTAARVRWLLDLARTNAQKPRAYVAKGIREGWAPEAPRAIQDEQDDDAAIRAGLEDARKRLAQKGLA